MTGNSKLFQLFAAPNGNVMIELVKDLPANVLGFRCSGRVTAADYETVLIPAVVAALEQHEKLRIYYEVANDFESIEPMAVFEDFKLALERLPYWERFAVVTDVGWIRQAVSAFAFLIHGAVRIFPLSEARTAMSWIAGA